MIDRRKWLSILVAGGGAAVSALFAVPVMLASLSPIWKGRAGGRWAGLGPLEEFTPGKIQPVVVQVERGDWARTLNAKTVFVYRRSVAEVLVYSRNCTDLSCPIVFDAGSECFFCPCHGGIFGKEGQRMAGPANQPLYRYLSRVRDGELEIDLYSLPPIT